MFYEVGTKSQICILGGSFNPPHKAHKKIAEILSERFDKVIIVPCGVRPDKKSANIIDIKHRMEMIKIAFSGMKNVVIDLYDLENSVYTPTYFLQRRYEDDNEVWHLVGEDIVEDIKSWEPFGEEIWNELNWLIIRRRGYMAKEFPPNCFILDMNIDNIIGSGTLVRERIKSNQSIDDLVESSIEKYINDNELYVECEGSEKMKHADSKLCDDNEASHLVRLFNLTKDKMSIFKYPDELFGKLEGNSIDEQLNSLKERFRELMMDYGVDRYSHYNCQRLTDVLNDISRKIIELEEIAERDINNGTYGVRSNIVIIKGESDKYEYQINNLEYQTEFSETFSGVQKDVETGTSEDVWIKMARIRDDNDEILDEDTIDENNEAISDETVALMLINDIKDDAFQKVRKQHFPLLLREFKYMDNGIKRLAIATKRFKDIKSYDFLELKEKFPDGIPLFHACWILARILSAAGHLHFQNILHGNIHPGGIFVVPQDHNVVLSDLEFAIIKYENDNSEYTGTNGEYTAPEVYKGSKPHPRSDIYSIGISMIELLGGDIRKRALPDKFILDGIKVLDERAIEGIRNLILSMVTQHELARSDDCWKAYHQLDELRKRAFGSVGFVEFKVEYSQNLRKI